MHFGTAFQGIQVKFNELITFLVNFTAILWHFSMWLIVFRFSMLTLTQRAISLAFRCKWKMKVEWRTLSSSSSPSLLSSSSSFFCFFCFATVVFQCGKSLCETSSACTRNEMLVYNGKLHLNDESTLYRNCTLDFDKTLRSSTKTFFSFARNTCRLSRIYWVFSPRTG